MCVYAEIFSFPIHRCTINPGENEGLVRYALDKYKYLTLAASQVSSAYFYSQSTQNKMNTNS